MKHMENKIYTKEINIDSTHILLKTDINQNIESLIKHQREIVSNEIKNNSQFLKYEPIPINNTHKILNIMTKASFIANTGPMAAVAGSISQICLDYLEKLGSNYSIIENGGDIALKTNKKAIVSIYAGDNNFSYNYGFKIKPKPLKYGICTSACHGPSRSFGKTDAAIVFSKESSIADSLATAIGNYGTGEDDDEIVNNALSKADEFREYFDGVVVIKNDVIGKTGHIPQLVSIKH